MAAPRGGAAAVTERASADARWLSPERTFTVFAALWAVAALFHEAARPHWAFGRSAMFVTLPAIWLLLRPTSVGRLVLMAALQPVQVVARGLARAPDHWLLATAVDLAIVIAFTWLTFRRRAAADRGALLRAFAPAARVSLLVVAFYAVFHRLNREFLDPAYSCAAAQARRISAEYPALGRGGWTSDAAIFLTLFVGALLPALIVWRRTRVAALGLAGLGYYVLALTADRPRFDVAATAFALFFLFLPLDYEAALRAAGGSALGLVDRVGRRRLLTAARTALAAAGLLLVISYAVGFAPGRRANLFVELARAAFAVYGAVLLGLFAVATWRGANLGALRGFDGMRLCPRVVALAPALLAANGLAPYLGLKTEGSFARYSNLRTEGEEWNHLVLPRAMRVARYQDDLTRIVASSDYGFRAEARRGSLIPFLELRTRASARPAASVTYVRAGRVHRVVRIADAPELAPPSFLQRTFLRFRAVPPLRPGQPCYY